METLFSAGCGFSVGLGLMPPVVAWPVGAAGKSEPEDTSDRVYESLEKEGVALFPK